MMFMPHWSERVRLAEERGDYDEAIAALSVVAECYSADYERHNAHLWHLDMFARAGRHVELAALGRHDVHARRRLTRLLTEADEPTGKSPDQRRCWSGLTLPTSY
jgi:hypothetical protein